MRVEDQRQGIDVAREIGIPEPKPGDPGRIGLESPIYNGLVDELGDPRE